MSTNSSTATADALEKLAPVEFSPRSIVVPLDGSQDSEAALPIAAYFAEVFGVDIRVVHATRTESIDDPGVAARFESHVADLVTRGCLPASTRTDVVAGAASDVILAAVSEADLVVLATHGHGGLQSALFGSVADKVVRGAKVPTIVVPVAHGPSPTPIRNVVIAVDESECAEHAAAVGRHFAERCGAAVTLVNSYLPTPYAGGMEAAYVPLDTTEIEQRASEALVAGAAEPGEKQFTVLGSTVESIAEVAQQLGAELVVAGSSGRGYFGRLLLGSVSEGLMHRLDRPLLVVPSPPK